MHIDEAKEIARYWIDGRKIPAIRILRSETAMPLGTAKAYLDQHGTGDIEKLFKQLCADFVQSKADILAMAKEEYRKLGEYIEELESDIANENNQPKDSQE